MDQSDRFIGLRVLLLPNSLEQGTRPGFEAMNPNAASGAECLIACRHSSRPGTAGMTAVKAISDVDRVGLIGYGYYGG
jgi:hypothetical protein